MKFVSVNKYIPLYFTKLQCKLYFLLDVKVKTLKAIGLEAEILKEEKPRRRLLQECRLGF